MLRNWPPRHHQQCLGHKGLISLYYISTNATGVKPFSAALNPLLLPLHKPRQALVPPFVRHTHLLSPGWMIFLWAIFITCPFLIVDSSDSPIKSFLYLPAVSSSIVLGCCLALSHFLHATHPSPSIDGWISKPAPVLFASKSWFLCKFNQLQIGYLVSP